MHAAHLALLTEGDGHLNGTYGGRNGGLATDAEWMGPLRRHAEPQSRVLHETTQDDIGKREAFSRAALLSVLSRNP